jgi:hypothetical protein
MGERYFAGGLQLTVVDRNARMVHRVKVQRVKGKAVIPAIPGARGASVASGSAPGAPGRPSAPAPRTRG